MNRSPVSSSQIASIGYDPASKVMEVEFAARKDAPGAVYQYANVPASVHREVVESESVGRAFGQLVKGKFDTTRIDRDPS